MKKCEFCRFLVNRNSFIAFLICICLLSITAFTTCAEVDTQSTSFENDTLSSVGTLCDYTVTLKNAEFSEGGSDDGIILTDGKYTSINGKSIAEIKSGWMIVEKKEGKNDFSATVDIDLGNAANGICRFYTRALRHVELNAEMPDKITFYYSLDGKDYVNVGEANTLSDVTASKCGAIYSVVLKQGVTARYIRCVIESDNENAFWINEVSAAAYKDVEYASKLSNGKYVDTNGIIYTVSNGNASIVGYEVNANRTIASSSNANFNLDESNYVLGIGTGNAVKVISDFIGDGRINYSGVPNNIKYIVIHNTGTVEEETDAARYNRRMHSTPEETSWHYTVDDNIIYHSLADSLVGWHAGSNLNYESIGIEMCVNGAPKRSNGNFVFEGESYEKWVNERFDKTMRNTAVLVAELLTRYGLKSDAVIQHYDSTEKNCPQWLRYKDGKYVSDGTLWVRFMAYVNEYYNMFNLDRSEGTSSFKTEIVIPDYIFIDGRIFPVTEIRSMAFADMDAQIRSIIIGNEVTQIEYGCFEGNDELELVKFKTENERFKVDEDGKLTDSDGITVFDPKSSVCVAPNPKESCTLDIREIDGKYYIFCDTERYTLAELADNYGADEFSANKMDGNIVGLEEIVGTGTVLSIEDARIYVVMLGDINGDAELDAYDYILVKRTCMKTYSPLKRQTLAMLLGNQEQVSVYDYIILKRHVMGTYNLFDRF